MPFGLRNAPATFQRLIDRVLKAIKGAYAYGYMDDIVIFSNTWEEHLKHVSEVLRHLNKAKLRINTKKCQWGAKEVKYLGHIIRHGEIVVDPEKVTAVKNILLYTIWAVHLFLEWRKW